MLNNVSSLKTGSQNKTSSFAKQSQLLTNKESSSHKPFLEYVKDGVKFVDASQKASDKMSTNLATGATENIHETMLSVSQAEVSFKLMVQVRNKVLEAYQEIMRMQV